MRRHRDDSAVLVVRAWVEPEGSSAIRARIMTRVDGRDVTVATACGVEQVCAVVERWLQQFERDSEVRDQ